MMVFTAIGWPLWFTGVTVLFVVRVWGSGVEEAVECGRFYCSPPEVVEYWWCWPATKDCTVDHPYLECCHCPTRFYSPFCRGLISHANSRKLASFHIGLKSTEVQSFPCPQIGHVRGAGVYQA